MAERDEKALIAALYEAVKDEKPLEDDPDFLLNEQTLRRYLVARTWNVDQATSLLKGTIEWRRETRPQDVVCTYCKAKPGYHAMRQVGFDRQRRPVLYSSFSQCFTLKNGVEDSLQHFIYLLENCSRCVDTDVSQIVWVLDCTGMKVTSCNPKMAMSVEKVLSNHYPERLGALICINHSAIFQGLWKAVKHFMQPDTVKKVHVEMSKNKIEEAFSTLFEDDLKDWLYQEIRMNKVSPISKTQREFWKPNDTEHDPRGCEKYVSEYVDSFSLEEYDSKRYIYRPHPCIVDDFLEKRDLKNGTAEMHAEI